VLSMFGLAAQAQILELARAVLAGEVETALRQLNDLATNGKDLGRLLSDLLNHFRNLLIFHVSRGDVKMLEVSEAEADSLGEQVKMANPEGLTRILEVFADAEMRLRDATSKKILVEVALLKAIEARQAVSIDSVLKQLQNLRAGGTADSGSSPAAAPTRAPRTHRAEPSQTATPQAEPRVSSEAAAAPQSAPLPSSAPTTAHETYAPPAEGSLETLWAQLREAVGRASPFTRTYLLEAHPVAFAKNVFTIGFGPESEDHIGLVDNPKNQALLQAKLQELGHANVQFKFVKAAAPAGRASTPAQSTPAPVPAAAPASKAPAPAPAAAARSAVPAPAQKEKLASVPFSKDDFKNDPLIQKALEVFKGQIVEVRA
jgi:DNA polymerase III subunit gamma/tau